MGKERNISIATLLVFVYHPDGNGITTKMKKVKNVSSTTSLKQKRKAKPGIIPIILVWSPARVIRILANPDLVVLLASVVVLLASIVLANTDLVLANTDLVELLASVLLATLLANDFLAELDIKIGYGKEVEM